MSHRTRVATVAVVVLFASVFASIASASCDPMRTPHSAGDWFDGWEAGTDFGGSSCINGSSANIIVKGPFVDSAANNDVSAWTMIFDKSTKWYGQAGYIKYPDGTFYSWDETHYYNTTLNEWLTPDHQIGPSISVGDNPNYQVTYSSNYMHYSVGGADSDDVSLNSEAYSGCDGEQGGEILNKDDQMVGEINSHEEFSNSSARKGSTGSYTWFSPNWSSPFAMNNVTMDPVSWLGNSTPGSDLDIWDTACTG